VFELGCGTGRFAAELLARELPSDARYVGVDVSPVMVRIARARLAAWAARTEVHLLEPPARTLPGADGSFDRFVATYVFDLLAADDARALFGEAHGLPRPAEVCLVPGVRSPRAGRGSREDVVGLSYASCSTPHSGAC